MKKRFQDSVRMSQSEQRKLLDQLDNNARAASPDSTTGDDRRAHRRHTYRPPAVAIQVEHPGGGHARYLVGARNLSQQGVGLIHGGFLYDNAPCTVVLETRRQQLLAFPGHIVTCRHVDGSIHEVGVRFEQEIDVETYFQLVEPANMAPLKNETKRDLPRLEGRCLYIDASVAACDQAQRYLADQAMEVTTVRHLGGGLDQLRRQPFDIVVCEADLEGVPGDESLTKIKQAGHEGPIAFVTSKPDQARDGRLQGLGAAQIALKPLSKPRLHDLLQRCLHPEALGDGLDYAQMVHSHMDAMQRRIDALEGSIIRGDIPNLRIVCESIAHASEAEGHEDLSDAANSALETMQGTGSTHAALEAVRKVAELAQAIQNQ